MTVEDQKILLSEISKSKVHLSMVEITLVQKAQLKTHHNQRLDQKDALNLQGIYRKAVSGGIYQKKLYI